jgi:hypothetical protein
MRTRLLTLLLLALAACRAPASEPPRYHPALAVVRIRSHGASGTVIATAPGKSWILSCAHMFAGPAEYKKPLRIDGPPQPLAAPKRAACRILAVDAQADLSLLEHDNGPFYCCPVAPAGHQPGNNLLSAGYDEMRWPVTQQRATLLESLGQTTFTRERPWHGRSGGGLIDVDSHVLIGVVQGYEVGGRGRGVYVSHAAVLTFVARHLPSDRPGELRPSRPRSPGYLVPPSCPYPGGGCPIPRGPWGVMAPADGRQLCQVLPWRRQVEQRLQNLERQQRQPPAPYAPPQAQPPIIIVQPPLQQFPIGGQPRQDFPIGGAPKQELPPSGAPKQDLPPGGAPKQELPPGGTPRQDLPVQPPPMPPADRTPQTYSYRPVIIRALSRPLSD